MYEFLCRLQKFIHRNKEWPSRAEKFEGLTASQQRIRRSNAVSRLLVGMRKCEHTNAGGPTGLKAPVTVSQYFSEGSVSGYHFTIFISRQFKALAGATQKLHTTS